MSAGATPPATPTPPTPPPEDAFFAAAYEVSKASITRARSGAEFIEKATAGILAVYAGVLGITFSVDDSPLPLRGIIPAIFLTLALAFASFYLAFPTKAANVTPPSEGTKQDWFNSFVEWMEQLVFLRTNFLRAALVALVFGALFLPTPFLKVKTAPAEPRTPTEWPAPPSDDVKLQKVLYEAQVAEVAKLREKAAPAPKGEFSVKEKWIWLAAGLALAIVALVAALGKAKPEKEPSSGIGVVPFIR